jgi:Fe-S oxidoreductase
MKNEYPAFGGDFQVQHAVEFLAELLPELQFQDSISQDLGRLTFHDSCYLGRHNNIYEAPRKLIHAAGGRIVEMGKTRSESFCCGAGGGLILAEEKLGSRINIKRVNMAAEAGAPILVSNCPFCLTMFEDGVKGADLEGVITPKDIVEILVEHL